MNTSFYNGVIGMKTSQVGIDVLGANIANDNTIGYKQQETSFSTLFSTTLSSLGGPTTNDKGVGGTATTTTMDLSQGSIQQTDNVFDIALEGKGWMAIKDAQNQLEYTRNGAFVRDELGMLVTQNGQKVQVANANNLQFDGQRWVFDTTKPTDNLVNQNVMLSDIILPDNITFPYQSTHNIKLSGNLPNTDIAPTPKPADLNSDFGVLYDSSDKNIKLQPSQDLVFGFGENISYSDGLVRYDCCVNDDEEDGEDVNIDFYVNDKHITTTVDDGSDSKTIIDAIADKLDEEGILYEKSDNTLQIKAQDKLTIKSNDGDVIKNSASMKRLVYDEDGYENSFVSISDFNQALQQMADDTYGVGVANVGLDENGKIYIQNNSENDIIASSYETSNSNAEFINNLGRLGNIIKAGTGSTTSEFKQDYQGFSGDVIDGQGNKDKLKFDFYKTKINNDTIIWRLDLSEVSQTGEILSTQSQDFTFNSKGALLGPSNITFDNNGVKATIDFQKGYLGITSLDKPNTGFSYAQDGLDEGYLDSYDIDDMGRIYANFSNGKNGVLGQIPIFHFQNEQGLDNLGGNLFTQTSNSGKAFLYQDTEGNYLSGAVVKNHSLESSNVNIGQAMTELIINQKAFDANSKSITTSDQMIQKAIDMKR